MCIDRTQLSGGENISNVKYKPKDRKNEFERVMAKRKWTLFVPIYFILLRKINKNKNIILPHVDRFRIQLIFFVVPFADSR